jgi:hypothetical protein
LIGFTKAFFATWKGKSPHKTSADIGEKRRRERVEAIFDMKSDHEESSETFRKIISSKAG